jgi:hypothetical protein
LSGPNEKYEKAYSPRIRSGVFEKLQNNTIGERDWFLIDVEDKSEHRILENFYLKLWIFKHG